MKPCHENNGAAIYVACEPRQCTILCFNVHPTVEYLNRKVSIGQLLQIYCRLCTVKAKNANKNI